MRVYIILGLICLIITICAWIIYAVNVHKIIRDQEREIEELHRELDKRQKVHREPTRLDNRNRVPDFGGF